MRSPSPWRVAAEELGIRVVAPYVVAGETCLALVRDFGSPRGTAVVARGSERLSAARAAAAGAGCFVSVVDGEAYCAFDRALFVGPLDDWGWFRAGAPPRWYTGRAWRD